MRRFQLLFCCLLTALSFTTQAQGARGNDVKLSDSSDSSERKQEKFAGRANNNAGTNDIKKSNTHYPLYTETREKKPLSKEERRALRRQVNETETKYPRKI